MHPETARALDILRPPPDPVDAGVASQLLLAAARREGRVLTLLEIIPTRPCAGGGKVWKLHPRSRVVVAKPSFPRHGPFGPACVRHSTRLNWHHHPPTLAGQIEVSYGRGRSFIRRVDSFKPHERAKARDQEAWERLVHLYGPLVSYWIRQGGLRPPGAKDVFQEVFQAVAGGIDRFHHDGPDATFRGWLRTITRSKIADHHRQAARRPEAVGGSSALQRLDEVAQPSEASVATGEADALQQLRLRALDMIRGEFEPRTWEAFWRSAVKEEPTREIAAELGMKPAAVRLAKSRVLRRLREELGELE